MQVKVFIFQKCIFQIDAEVLNPKVQYPKSLYHPNLNMDTLKVEPDESESFDVLINAVLKWIHKFLTKQCKL